MFFLHLHSNVLLAFLQRYKSDSFICLPWADVASIGACRSHISSCLFVCIDIKVTHAYSLYACAQYKTKWMRCFNILNRVDWLRWLAHAWPYCVSVWSWWDLRSIGLAVAYRDTTEYANSPVINPLHTSASVFRLPSSPGSDSVSDIQQMFLGFYRCCLYFCLKTAQNLWVMYLEMFHGDHEVFWWNVQSANAQVSIPGFL